jgi:broad specificity phosphatase PhoE
VAVANVRFIRTSDFSLKVMQVTTLYLVRHARPAASFGDSVDPGLDATGNAQAEAVARELAGRLRPLAVYSSPLQRCRETAQPLAAIWGVSPIISADVGEIPSPPLSLAARQTWLRNAMASTWAGLMQSAPAGSPDFDAWRAGLLDAVRAMPADAVVFSHFVAINAIVGAAQASELMVCFRPDHASVTTIEVAGDRISVRELGRQTGEGTTVLAGR